MKKKIKQILPILSHLLSAKQQSSEVHLKYFMVMSEMTKSNHTM